MYHGTCILTPLRSYLAKWLSTRLTWRIRWEPLESKVHYKSAGVVARNSTWIRDRYAKISGQDSRHGKHGETIENRRAVARGCGWKFSLFVTKSSKFEARGTVNSMHTK